MWIASIFNTAGSGSYRKLKIWTFQKAPRFIFLITIYKCTSKKHRILPTSHFLKIKQYLDCEFGLCMYIYIFIRSERYQGRLIIVWKMFIQVEDCQKERNNEEENEVIL